MLHRVRRQQFKTLRSRSCSGTRRQRLRRSSGRSEHIRRLDKSLPLLLAARRRLRGKRDSLLSLLQLLSLTIGEPSGHANWLRISSGHSHPLLASNTYGRANSHLRYRRRSLYRRPHQRLVESTGRLQAHRPRRTRTRLAAAFVYLRRNLYYLPRTQAAQLAPRHLPAFRTFTSHIAHLHPMMMNIA